MNSIFKSIGALALTLAPAAAQLLIQRPETVRNRFNNGLIQGSTAAFGTPVYGDMILGQLVYGEAEDTSRPHCDSNYTLPETSFPKIVIVKRGGCQFVDKVLVAQNDKAAAAVVVVDDDESRTPSDIRLVIMADERWGKRDIAIPSVLVTKREGDILVEEVKKGTEVLVRMEWDLPNEHTVNVDMWASPSIPDTTKFLKNFSPIARKFKHDIDFVPHYWIFSLSPMSLDMDMCTSNDGKYCAFDPDLNGKLTGRDAVYESVRQYCLWSTTTTRNSTDVFSGRYSDEYWKYVELIQQECPVTQNSQVAKLTEECSYGLMNKLSVDVNRVKMCVRDDFNDILDKQIRSLAWSPSAMMINNYRYSGPLDADLVTKAVCTGFISEPETCSKDVFLAESHSAPYGYETPKGFPWWGYVLITTTAVLFAIAAIAVSRVFVVRLRRQLRYEVFEEVNNQLEKGSGKTSSLSFKTGAHTPDTSRDENNDFSERNHNFVDVRIV